MGADKTGGKLEHRIRQLEAELEGEKKLSEGYLSQLKYLQADFENLQKKVERDFARETQGRPETTRGFFEKPREQI